MTEEITPLWLGAAAIEAALPIAAAVEAIDRALCADGLLNVPERAHLEGPAGTLLLMPAVASHGSGVKLVTVAPRNPERGLPLIHGLFVLFDGGSLVPVAIMDGGALTVLRTAAVSAAAARRLARPDARHLVLFGAGVQARAHLRAFLAIRDLTSVTIVDTDATRAEALAAETRVSGVDAVVGDGSAVRTADIICTCTTSRDPLVDGTLVKSGTYINAMGSYTPDARELDDATMRRAAIVVETRAATLRETGDLAIPLRDGVITEQRVVAELPEVLRAGGLPDLDRAGGDLIVYKSVGHAFEDLIVAQAVLDSHSSP